LHQLAQAIQSGSFNTSQAKGTADALSADFTPAITSLRNGLTVQVRAAFANATPAPTLAVNGLAAKTIVKGGRINQREAIKRYDKRAFDSMFEQLSVLDQKGTFVPVDPKTLSKQEFKRIIRSFMFLSEKFDPQGVMTKLKARLVADGSMQNRDRVDMNVSSPTVSATHIYCIAAIAAVERREVATGDVGAAFINAYVPDGTLIHVRLDQVNTNLLCNLVNIE
jgi:hypothetical protein